MKQNPTKCAFGMTSGKFLEFMVSYRAIKANTKKIQAIKQRGAPKIVEVQRLIRRVANLSQYISRLAEQ